MKIQYGKLHFCSCHVWFFLYEILGLGVYIITFAHEDGAQDPIHLASALPPSSLSCPALLIQIILRISMKISLIYKMEMLVGYSIMKPKWNKWHLI